MTLKNALHGNKSTKPRSDLAEVSPGKVAAAAKKEEEILPPHPIYSCDRCEANRCYRDIIADNTCND